MFCLTTLNSFLQFCLIFYKFLIKFNIVLQAWVVVPWRYVRLELEMALRKQPFIRHMPMSIKSRAPEPACWDSDPTSSKNTGQLLPVSKMKFPQLSVSLMTLCHEHRLF